MTDDEIRKIRKKNNSMLGLILVFSITVAKMMGGATMEAYDHVRRPQLEQIN
ncbi:cytochrome C oxidase assembly protein [Amylibacter sp.]|nr:cytochrome C oxidase assembly protein [Amylibacter sp.]